MSDTPNEKFTDVNILLFALDYTFYSAKDKFLIAGHKVPQACIGDRIEELKDDLKTFPDTQLLVIDPGAAHDGQYEFVATAKAAVPQDIPIMLYAMDAAFWQKMDTSIKPSPGTKATLIHLFMAAMQDR